jgi:hypothetical protein
VQSVPLHEKNKLADLVRLGVPILARLQNEDLIDLWMSVDVVAAS